MVATGLCAADRNAKMMFLIPGMFIAIFLFPLPQIVQVMLVINRRIFLFYNTAKIERFEYAPVGAVTKRTI